MFEKACYPLLCSPFLIQTSCSDGLSELYQFFDAFQVKGRVLISI